eukprot:2287014-Pyramimonas_sp.AAC.1
MKHQDDDDRLVFTVLELVGGNPMTAIPGRAPRILWGWGKRSWHGMRQCTQTPPIRPRGVILP